MESYRFDPEAAGDPAVVLDTALAFASPRTARARLLREYLQAMALRSLHEAGAFNSLSFVGGTALRFLFELARFSEDLDFSVEDPVDFTPGNGRGGSGATCSGRDSRPTCH